MPAQYPLNLYRGDTYRWRFSLWLDAAKTVPIELEGVEPKAEIRNRPGGSTIVALDCSIDDSNTVVVELSAEASRRIPNTGGVWDLELTYPSGDVGTVLAGNVSITLDVTNSTAALR